MNKNDLIQCFYDSANTSEHILKSETKKAIKSNKVYKENFVARKKNVKQVYKDIFNYLSVESNTSFNAAKKYLQYGKTAVLNFANPHYPGGGVHNGAMAQEECLCRSSNLYPCISNKNVFNDYYLYNKDMNHYFFSDRLIYTKGITVFKDDSDAPQIMPKNEWFNVDVITCAAPYIAKRKYTNRTALKELFKGRIKNIFEAAIDNDVEVVILGAFGCGAFKNPPEVVAKAFHEVIDENNYGNYFKKIVFAIPKGNNFYRFDDEFFGEYHTTVLVTPPMPLIEPLRSKCENHNYFMDYDSWKRRNKYYGKQFSILGDSISTLAGYNPKGYKVFYDDENCEKSVVKEMKDTWWGKVIDFFGGELLINNSWSGSRVTRLPDKEELFPSGCSDERTSSLHINNIKPDVIIVYLGTNDWAFGAAEHYTDYILTEDFHCNSFDFAYSTMLSKIKANYPDAEIWCCTLNTTFMSSNSSFKFPYEYGEMQHIEEYNQIIKDTASQYQCKVINLYDYHLPYDSIDGSHPNADGMNTLAMMMIREIGGKEVDQFLDCENDLHKFSLTYGYDQNFYGGYHVCNKCGKIKHESEVLKSADNKSPYIWDSSSMNINDIIHFSVSFGNCPIVHISYDGEKLIVYNRINGSRDGWMSFSDGFFDNKIVNLTDEQKVSIIDFIKKIDFSTWKTEDPIRENYEMEVCGFCINNSFIITFKNGECFKCYEPVYKEYEQLVDFLKSFCNSNWFEPYYEKKYENEKDTVLLEEIYDADAEYVRLPSDITRLLFGDTIRLYDTDTNQDIEFQKVKFDVGRSLDCELQIDNNYISQIHASFYYENSYWFIMDKGSTNGTWLNDKKLEPNKKYELYSDDVINFAHIKIFVFYKTKNYSNAYQHEQFIHPEFKIGTVIAGKYELLNLIGKGGTFEVYLSRDLKLNKVWAVKVLLKNQFRCNDVVINMAMQEANMIKSLNHHAIPRIVDVIDNDQYFAIVQDYVEGATLDSIVKNYGAQPVEQVVDWAKEICDVLDYFHTLNPPHIYRDMKPSNLILEPNGNIKIIDFGIMRTYKSNQTEDTSYLGTKGYAAPEQYGGRGQTDARTDIYGLGMTMYLLLTGIDPKEQDFVVHPICQVNPNLPKGLEYIIDKCIQIDPKNRYQSCVELMNDLNRYQQLPLKKSLFSKLFNK